MRESFGPYLTGEQVRRGEGWALYRGRHRRSAGDVWMLRALGAAPRLDDVKSRISALRSTDRRVSVPTALSPDGADLVSITETDGRCALEEFTPPDVEAAWRLVRTACEAVAGLHAHGLAHGRIDGWLIDVDPTGHARLRGSAELAGPGDATVQREDERKVGRVLRHTLRAVSLPLELDSALRELARGTRRASDIAGRAAVDGNAVDEDAVDEDTAITAELDAVATDDGLDDGATERDLISSLRGASAPEPAASGRRRHAAPAEPTTRSTRMLSVVAVLLVALLAIVVWLTRDGGSQEPVADAHGGTTSTAPDAADQLTQRLHELYAARSAAISEGDRLRLTSVYVPDSPMLSQDESLISQLASDGVQVDGFALSIVEVTELHIDGQAASVVLLDKIAPFELVAVDGSRTKAHGRPEAITALTLEMGETGWLIQAAERP